MIQQISKKARIIIIYILHSAPCTDEETCVLVSISHLFLRGNANLEGVVDACSGVVWAVALGSSSFDSVAICLVGRGDITLSSS